MALGARSDSGESVMRSSPDIVVKAHYRTYSRGAKVFMSFLVVIFCGATAGLIWAMGLL